MILSMSELPALGHLSSSLSVVSSKICFNYIYSETNDWILTKLPKFFRGPLSKLLDT
jgi:hypothetical protein